MDYVNDEPKSGELIPHDNKKPRMQVGAIDDAYIECFLDNPSSKIGALRKAQDMTGELCCITTARACQIHSRLAHKIDTELTRRILEGATLGYSVLYKMAADEDTSEAVRAKCASLLIDYAGKNKIDKTAIKDRSRKSILDEIKQTQERIALLTTGDVK